MAESVYNHHMLEKDSHAVSELKISCADMAVKFKFLFILALVSFIINFFLSIAAFSEHLYRSLPFVLVFAALKITSDLSTGIVTLTLSEHNVAYKTSGIFYLIHSALWILTVPLLSQKNTGAAFYLYETLGALASIFNFLFHIKIAAAMSEVFEPVSLALKVSWTDFRQWNIRVLVGSLICSPLLIIPWIKYAALIGASVIAFAMLIIQIWRFTIIFKSYKMMEKFSLSE